MTSPINRWISEAIEGQTLTEYSTSYTQRTLVANKHPLAQVGGSQGGLSPSDLLRSSLPSHSVAPVPPDQPGPAQRIRRSAGAREPIAPSLPVKCVDRRAVQGYRRPPCFAPNWPQGRPCDRSASAVSPGYCGSCDLRADLNPLPSQVCVRYNGAIK